MANTVLVSGRNGSDPWGQTPRETVRSHFCHQGAVSGVGDFRIAEMVMRGVVAVVMALLVSVMPAIAAAPPAKKQQTAQEFASPEAVLAFINGYRAKPEPDKLPLAVQRMSQFGIFKDLETNGIYIGFMAGVLGGNAAKAEALVAKMFPMPPDDQVAIVRAIAYSGLPEWQGVMNKFAERMPARKVMMDRYLTGKLPTLAKLELDSGPAPLDTLWGFYFATGSPDPILRIVSILGWSKDANNIERLTIGSMAKWTLAKNALADKELLDVLKGALKYETKETAALVREVVEAAETFETAKIRKEAMGSIEQLKIKGPQNARNYAWWGTAGQTALALGCVVAGALGQVQVGLPCVIGGALSTAALKVFQPQP